MLEFITVAFRLVVMSAVTLLKVVLLFPDLPTSTVDLIINCLDGGSQISKERTTTWYRYIANWCNTSRARVLAIGMLYF